MLEVDDGGMVLENSVILAISSLPRLRCLRTNIPMVDDACSSLARFRGLKDLQITSLTD